jgi:hypothetical protein
MNQCLKYGDYACKPTMTIDKSSENQIRLAENQARQRELGKAKRIHESKLWSRSKTKKFLTDYMEGVAVKNFDKRMNYCVCCIASNTWLAGRKDIVDRFEFCEGIMRCKKNG